MFRNAIRETPLTTEIANGYFTHIRGDYFERDSTFVATLRALVAPRMSEDEQVRIEFTSTNYSASTIGEVDTNSAVAAISAYDSALNRDATGFITIHSFNAPSQEDNYACLELMKSQFEKRHSGWHRLEKVTEFYRKMFYCVCFINPDKKNVVLYVDSLDICRMHCLQCSILAFLPWYFDPKAGVTELEMDLTNSLLERRSTKYEKCIADIAKQYDFRVQKIKTMLAGFETRYEKKQCSSVRNEITKTMDALTDYNRRMGDLLRQKRDLENTLLGLETKIAQSEDEDSEIMDYFLRNNKLFLESVSDNELRFSCQTYLAYFDEEMAKDMIDNPRSYIYRPNGNACNNYIKAEDMKILMYAIFVDQTLRIKFCAAYRFDLCGTVSPVSGHDFGYEFSDCMPNTHINRYSCMGNYTRTINSLLQKYDYIGAIEQCVASCASLNFADSTVMAEFIRCIYGFDSYGVNNRCIELPDGKVVNPKDAVEWLKAQQGSTEEGEADE